MKPSAHNPSGISRRTIKALALCVIIPLAAVSIMQSRETDAQHQTTTATSTLTLTNAKLLPNLGGGEPDPTTGLLPGWSVLEEKADSCEFDTLTVRFITDGSAGFGDSDGSRVRQIVCEHQPYQDQYGKAVDALAHAASFKCGASNVILTTTHFDQSASAWNGLIINMACLATPSSFVYGEPLIPTLFESGSCADGGWYEVETLVDTDTPDVADAPFNLRTPTGCGQASRIA